MTPPRRACALAVVALAGCFGGSVHHGPPSDHFDGNRFTNPTPRHRPDTHELLFWLLDRDEGAWRDHVDAEPGPAPPDRVDGEALRVTFVGHSTVLVQTASLNILFDPLWSDRVGPVSWAGPTRVRPPGIRFEDLPPIDVVAVSHNHYDHLDMPTLARLAREHSPRIFVGLGVAGLLEDEGVPGGEEVDWWDAVPLRRGVTLHGLPAQHFSGRGMLDQDRTLWLGFAIETPAGPIVYAGDTGMGPQFLQARERFGPTRLAILPIGAYRPRWFMESIHLSPDDAVFASRILGARVAVPCHYGTFAQGDDGELEPIEDLRRALRPDDRDRFWVLAEGEGRDVAVDPALTSQRSHPRR